MSISAKLKLRASNPPPSASPKTLCTSVKDNDTADNLLLNRQKRKMKIANAQNNTFASPDTQADASACKRVVFLPTHPSPPTTLTQYEWISREKRVDNNIKF